MLTFGAPDDVNALPGADPSLDACRVVGSRDDDVYKNTERSYEKMN